MLSSQKLLTFLLAFPVGTQIIMPDLARVSKTRYALSGLELNQNRLVNLSISAELQSWINRRIFRFALTLLFRAVLDLPICGFFNLVTGMEIAQVNQTHALDFTVAQSKAIDPFQDFCWRRHDGHRPLSCRKGVIHKVVSAFAVNCV